MFDLLGKISEHRKGELQKIDGKGFKWTYMSITIVYAAHYDLFCMSNPTDFHKTTHINNPCKEVLQDQTLKWGALLVWTIGPGSASPR